MSPQLLHIYGPLYVNSYGLAIATGLIIFVWLCQRNKELQRIITPDQFSTVVMLGIMSALIGGRLWFLLSEWHSINSVTDLAKPWLGGFSVLGSIVGVLLTIPWYLQKYTVPWLQFFDIIALYTPLFHAISRIGCFVAGCCYGCPTTYWWGVTYTHLDSMAPLGITLHPTQLYSSFLLLVIFGILYVLKNQLHKGQLLMAYLIATGTERFIVDIFRDDRTFYSTSLLSVNQLLSLVFIIVGLYGFYNLKRRSL